MTPTEDIRETGGVAAAQGGQRRVVIRRRKVRGQAAGGAGETASAYFPPPNGGTPHAPTAVELAPDVIAGFDPTAFSDAALPVFGREEESPQVEVAAPQEQAEQQEQASETASALPELSSEEDSVAAAGDAPALQSEAVAEAAVEPEQEVAAEATAVEEKPQADGAGSDETAETVVQEDVLPRKVSVDAAARIADELLSAAEAKQREEQSVSESATTGEDADSGDTVKKATGPRVFGRIDLHKKATPVKPSTPAKAAPPADKPGADAAGRKRKRKVVRKEDMFDALERSYKVRPRKKRAAPGAKVAKTELTTPRASKRVIKINEVATAGELAKAMGVKAGDVLGSLIKLGSMLSINDAVDFDTATLVAEEFGYTVENTAVNVDALLEIDTGADSEDVEQLPRPPVVTVMGHVDHGKTSLLDVIRSENVVASESGGITQHIGAYMVSTSQGDVCFLDTPGHAAFTAMRARGASITDIVILVVAADDGVMPQTIEAVNHAQAAELPVVVAVNKMDKPDANPDRVKQQLSELGLQPEEWGGDCQFVAVSALQKTGIDDLLEAVNLQAQMLELKAPVETMAKGTVIEARLDRGRGPVATVLIEQGTLHRGDHFVCNETVGRVRAMTDYKGKQIKEAGPSTPVEITGLDGVPAAGDSFVAVEDPSRAAQVAEHRSDISRKQQLASSTRMSLEDLQARVASGEAQELKIVLKADVDGSVEAIRQALEKLSTDEVKLQVIHGGVGAVNESDVQLAMASNAIITAFHVRPEVKARALAEREKVEIRPYTVIYELVDDVKQGLEGLLAPDFVEKIEGRVEVREVFSVPGGTIAGCYVTEGTVKRNQSCRLLRDNVVIHTGKIGSLRRFKDDVREVHSGYECGVGLDRYNDIKVGDVIEAFRMDEVKRTLESVRAAAEAAEASK